MSDMNFPAPKFDTSFQRAVLKLALAEDFFAAQLVRYLSSDRERIKINIFDTKQLQILFDCIVKSMDKYKTRPSDGQLRQFISEYAPEEQVALLKTYEDILASGTNDDAYYRQHLKAFIQQIKLAIGFSKIKNTWNSNKLETPDVMQSIVDEIRRVEFEDEDILTLEDIDEITNDAKHMLDKLIPTGLAPLDKDLLGGLPRETFVVALGSTNVGKSLFCISLACNAIRTNHKVLHISLEGMRNEALMRYTANLAQVPSRGLMQGDLTPPQKKQLDRIKEYEKNLRIHNMLGFGVTIEDLAAKCREIYKDFKFDMLLVDYSQLLESKQKTEGSRQTQTYVHRALAAMSREFDCVVLSPVQATRGAQKEQSGYKNKRPGEGEAAPILRSDDISEDINIARVAGVILSLNRTDDEAKEGKLRVYLEKQRLEQKGRTYGVMTKYAFCQLITDQTYDPNAVTDAASVFDEDNSATNTKMTAMLEFKEKNQQAEIRSQINDLIGQQYSIQNSMKEALIAANDGTLSDEEKVSFGKWLDGKELEKSNLIIKIRGLVAVYYPKASKELFVMSKQSLVDLEKSGTAPITLIREHKEKVRHLSYLYEKESTEAKLG